MGYSGYSPWGTLLTHIGRSCGPSLSVCLRSDNALADALADTLADTAVDACAVDACADARAFALADARADDRRAGRCAVGCVNRAVSTPESTPASTRRLDGALSLLLLANARAHRRVVGPKATCACKRERA